MYIITPIGSSPLFFFILALDNAKRRKKENIENIGLEVITRYQRNRKNENLINIKNNSL
jgi:hypothetical protein